MASNIDVGDLQAKFGIDLSNLASQVAKATEMIKSMTTKIDETTANSASKMNEKINKAFDASKGAEDLKKKTKEATDKAEDEVDDFLVSFNGKTVKMADYAKNGYEKSFGAAVQEATKAGQRIQKSLAASVQKPVKATIKTNTKVPKLSESGIQQDDSLRKSIERQRVAANSEITKMVQDINSKMEQAKAAQLKIQSIISKKNSIPNLSTSESYKFDSQIASAQAQMHRYQNTAKQLAANMRDEFGAVPDELKKISAQMTRNEAQIDTLRNRIKSLGNTYEQQKSSIGSFAKGFKTSDNDTSLKTKAEIDKLRTSMNKLISENDSLASTYANAEDRSKSLKKALSGVNTELKDQVAASRQARSNMANVGNSGKNTGTSKRPSLFRRMGDNFANFRNKFKSGSSSIKNDSSGITSRLSGINRTLKMMWSSVLIFGILGSGLQNLMGSLGNSLMVNRQFANSLNQIKVNLATAFYPIYTAIMPALNTLMNGLAKVTGHLASFISMLFGTTFSKAKQGAAGLQSSIQALNQSADGSGVSKTASGAKKLADNAKDATDKAKELQQSLAGFDEINTLQKNNDSSTSSTPDTSGSTPSLDAPTGLDFGGATANYQTPIWLKNLAKDLWDPIKAGWDTTGKKVIAAFKYALSEVNSLVKDIGKSFLEVWDNGTGQKFIENLLVLLADVLNIVGDIARAFRKAWNDDGRGTRLIQSYFDAFNRILTLLHQINQAFRDAWNSGVGVSINEHILNIITNIFKTVGALAGKFSEAWQHADLGQKIFKDILGLVDKVLGTLDKMTGATVNWAKSLDFTPLLQSIHGLLKSMQPFTQNIGDGLKFLYEKVLLPLASFTIEKVIPDFLDLLSAAIKAVNAIIEALKPLGKWFFDNFLQPLAKYTGGSFHSVIQGIVDILDKFTNWIKTHQKIVEGITVALATLFAFKVATSAFDKGTYLVDKLVRNIGKLFGKEHVLRDLFGKLTGINDLKDGVENVKILASAGWDKIKIGGQHLRKIAKLTWSGLKTGATHLMNIAKLSWNGIKLGAGKLKDIAQLSWSSLKAAKDDMKEIWQTANQNWQQSGIFQSMHSAGGFSKLTTAGKVTNGLVGAGIAVDAGVDIYSAIKAKNPTKKFESYGSGIGKAIGGGLGMWFGGPLGAALGSQIGGVIGTWGGESAKSFSDGWSAVGKGKKPDDWLGELGWNSRIMSNKVVAWWDDMKKNSDTKRAEQQKDADRQNAAFIKGWNSFWGDVGDKVQKTWDDTKKTTSTWGTNFNKWRSNFGRDFKKGWDETWEKVGSKLKKTWDDAKTNTETTWSNIKTGIGTAGSNIKTNMETWSGQAKDKVIGAWKTMKTKGDPYFKGIKDTAKSAFDTVGGWASGLGEKIGGGLSRGFEAVKRGAASIANGIIGPVGTAVNGVISGINWVLGKVGAGSHALGKWHVPKFAQGGYHKGGLALVNDAPGQNYREMFKLPNGRRGMFPAQRNMLVDLPAGTQVLDGNRTVQIPHYASGIFGSDFMKGFNLDFGNIFSGVSSSISSAIDDVKDFTKGVWKYVTHPIDLISQGIGKFFTLPAGLAGSISGGAMDLIKNGSVDWIRDFIKSNAPKKKKKSKKSSGKSGGLFDFDFDFENLFGFADGGFLNKEGLYKMGEGNLSEMVVPLTKPARAVELMKQGLKVMNLSGMELAAPDMATNNLADSIGTSFNGGSQSGVGSMTSTADMQSIIVAAILEAMAELKRTSGSNDDQTINMNVDGDRFADIVIKAVNKKIVKLGFNPLNI